MSEATAKNKPKTPLPKTTSDKIARAKELKTKGNEHFKNGNFKGAKLAYSQVFAFIGGLRPVEDPAMRDYRKALGTPSPTEDEALIIRQISIDVNANLSAVFLKLEDPQQAIMYCDKVLELEQEHVKAMFRKGQAYAKLKDLANAKVLLTNAAKLEPNNVAIRSELRNLTNLLVEREKAEKRAFQKGFNSGSGGGQSQERTSVGSSGHSADHSGCGHSGCAVGGEH